MSEVPVPQYHRVKQALLREIESSDYAPDEPFITTREVCSRFGVSTTTAVRALDDLVREGVLVRKRGRGTFVTDKRQVRESIPSRNTRTLGCIFSGLQGRHMSEMLSGIESVCREAGYRVLLFDSAESAEKEAHNLQRALDAEVSGLIVCPVDGYSNSTHFNKLLERGLPLVMVDRYYPGLVTDVVVPDNFAIGYQLTDYLIGKGHRYIATLWGDTQCTSVQDRLSGYRRALQEHGLPIIPELAALISYEKLPERKRSELLQSWLEAPHRPSAFLCVNGYVMALLVKDLIHLGVNLSEEEAVLAGMDDVGPHDLLPFATIAAVLPSYEMGSKAMHLLLDHIERGEETRHILRHIVLPIDVSIKDLKPVHLQARAAKGARADH
ncbi:GntR family transcriptional regulator [Rubrobacter taiwanensis]|uniref:GntR family transcriptional regulator n=1 Tax=Rubrobacter taiwanensis TaxID=185139 RepID=A0A4R1BI38_9ACTN|nr:GntR family transcriptional regulator [Rubrobacter taiwanensis]TCJ16901.1 GntR family transcriptional regulator [Rubrobacter taiwanensis]